MNRGEIVNKKETALYVSFMIDLSFTARGKSNDLHYLVSFYTNGNNTYFFLLFVVT
jgi:hypothetical protein